MGGCPQSIREDVSAHVRVGSLTSKYLVHHSEPTATPSCRLRSDVCVCGDLSSLLLGMVSTTCGMCCVGMAASTRSMCSSSFSRNAINSARLYAPVDSASVTAAGVMSTAAATHTSTSAYNHGQRIGTGRGLRANGCVVAQKGTTSWQNRSTQAEAEGAGYFKTRNSVQSSQQPTRDATCRLQCV